MWMNCIVFVMRLGLGWRFDWFSALVGWGKRRGVGWDV